MNTNLENRARRLLENGQVNLGGAGAPAAGTATSAPDRKTTNHVPLLIMLLGCLLIAPVSLGGAIVLYQFTFSGLAPAYFAMSLFATACLVVLGFVAAIMTLGVFLDWMTLFIRYLEERSGLG